MFGVQDNHVAAGALAKHAGSCACNSCQRKSSLAKRDIGQHEEKMHLATANAMHHSAMQDAHQRAAYGWDQRDKGLPELPVEMKAKHLEAASAHGMARDHFQDAARSYRDGLPKGAAEHEKIAGEAAEHAKKLTEKLKA